MPDALPITCCERGSSKGSGLQWREPDHSDGPDRAGYCLDVSGSYPDPAWVRIDYCPYCGARLPGRYEEPHEYTVSVDKTPGCATCGEDAHHYIHGPQPLDEDDELEVTDPASPHALATKVASELADLQEPEVLHYRTQDGQPYGSVSNKCDKCGVQVGVFDLPRWTDDVVVYENPPAGFVNCRET